MLKRIRKRAKLLGFTSCVPCIKVIVLPSGFNTPPADNHKPLKTQADSCHLYEHKSNITRVIGGICYTIVSNTDEQINTYTEVNEYGIVFRQDRLILDGDENNKIYLDDFINSTSDTLVDASKFYEDCLSSDICIRVHIKNVFQKTLINDIDRRLVSNGPRTLCLESNIKVSTECPTANLHENSQRKEMNFELMQQLVWAFNVPIESEHEKETLKKKILEYQF